jgi:hypothetical protein
MTGHPDHNRAAFTYAWNRLQAAGYTAISPHFLENGIEVEARAKSGVAEIYRYALPIDLFAMSSCDAVMSLPGWENSRGSLFEGHGAGLMEIPIVDGYGLLPSVGRLREDLTLEQYMDRVIIYLETEANLCPMRS